MQQALYHPLHGYYARGQQVFGAAGDFVTSPELTALFGETLARGLMPLLERCPPRIIEFGAGRGKLALDIVSMADDRLREYWIVEVSGGLKSVQQSTLAALPTHLRQKVRWLDQLPDRLEGIVLGNEVLDATPVRRFRWQPTGVEEAYVQTVGDHLEWRWLAADERLRIHVTGLHALYGPWPAGYTSEWAEQSDALVRTLTDSLHGVVVQIDYGYHEALYYAPHRSDGTLRATQRHVAHSDLLANPGDQDLTAHVNFSAAWRALEDAGGTLEGYVTQAGLLMGLGILELAQQQPDLTDPVRGGHLRQGLNLLLSEADMGEQFKALVWSKGVELDESLLQQALLQYDRSGQL
ncbi:SAM-dependent methyltransferase [Limnobacter humi]|uniref:SAM-dependent methyltransferase n=1 Tax=Limnobacter humi TaxID=1778671 RepID=A0ABT1WG51_9BURK|nr:SAM-dependent methyltransferase [Limnobacter humi]MCQ8895389.1 SAM-dependent methyltransferase [Limnobacter humi]